MANAILLVTKTRMRNFYFIDIWQKILDLFLICMKVSIDFWISYNTKIIWGLRKYNNRKSIQCPIILRKYFIKKKEKEMVLLSHLLSFSEFLLYAVCISNLRGHSSPQAHDCWLYHTTFLSVLSSIARNSLYSLIANSPHYTCFEYVLWMYDSLDTLYSLHDISTIPFPEKTTRWRILRGHEVSQNLKLCIF